MRDVWNLCAKLASFDIENKTPYPPLDKVYTIVIGPLRTDLAKSLETALSRTIGVSTSEKVFLELKNQAFRQVPSVGS